MRSPLGRRATPVRLVTLLTRVDCHLCAVAGEVVARAAAEVGVPVEERDVDAAAADRAAYGEKVPVVLLDGVEHAFWQVDERALRRALRR